MNFLLEFAPLALAVAILGFVPLVDFPFRRFGFPLLWATLGVLASRPVATAVMRVLGLDGLKADTLLLFQGATLLAVTAMALGERLRGAVVSWRPLIASLGFLSVLTTFLAHRTLDGWGPRPGHLGLALAWVSLAGYVLGPAALAAFVYFLGVQRAELIERFSKKPPDVMG
jgi:hypothetical protein